MTAGTNGTLLLVLGLLCAQAACNRDGGPGGRGTGSATTEGGRSETGDSARQRRGEGGGARAEGPDGQGLATTDEAAELPDGTPEQRRSLQQAKALALSGSCDEAEPHLEAVLAGPLTTTKINALLLLGDCYRSTGRVQENIAIYERARSYVPGVPEVHAALGRAYLEAGRDDEAVVALQQALRLAPELVGSYIDLGIALNRLGRSREAALVYEDYEGELARLGGQLRQGSEPQRLAAAEALALVESEQAVQGLVSALADESPQVRIAAASGLGDSRSPRALDGLRARLSEEMTPEVVTALHQSMARLEQEALPRQVPGTPTAPTGTAAAPAASAGPASPGHPATTTAVPTTTATAPATTTAATPTPTPTTTAAAAPATTAAAPPVTATTPVKAAAPDPARLAVPAAATAAARVTAPGAAPVRMPAPPRAKAAAAGGHDAPN